MGAAALPFLGKAAATTAATTVPASMAGTYFAGATGTTASLANALNAGITAGSALGGGGALAAPGLTSIFANPMAALGGLPAGTVIPTVAAKTAAGPGLLNTLGMNPLFGVKELAAAKAAGSGLASTTPANLANLNAGFVPNSAISTAAKTTPSMTSKVPEMLSGKVPSVADYASTLAKSPPGFSQQELVSQAAQTAAAQSPIIKGENFMSNLGNLIQDPSVDAAIDYAKEHPYATAGLGYGAYQLLKPKEKAPEQDKGMIRPYEFTRTQRPEAYAVSPLQDTSERMYFDSKFTPLEPYSATSPQAKEIEKIAKGGIASAYAVGGPVETMSAMNSVGGNMMYPQAGLQTALYSNPMVQRPEAVNVIAPSGEPAVGAYSGEQKFAGGGISDLGDYSDGGRLLKGPGDGVSDSIPAVIGKRQPARLADGEFVVPARIVSELGNGSTEAGARKLYAMMERVQKARSKSVGKGKVAVNSKADKHLPA